LYTKGVLFGVGVGPGDPEMMTIKAVRTIEACEILAIPRTNGEKTLALDIASGAVNLSGKELLHLDFPMTRDASLLSDSHKQAAKALTDALSSGKSVAMLTLGDPSVYSTFDYTARIVKKEGYEVRVIPGITSFCAAAALLNTGITDMDSPLHILPAGSEGLEEGLKLSGAKVLMKFGRNFPAVREALKRTGQYEKAALIKNCGLEGEEVFRELDLVGDPGYFSLIIVKQ